jgi:cell division transport system ATP-binding protein
MDHAQSLIEFDGVTLLGKKDPIVRDISLSIVGGDFGVVIGPTGGGKTTILRLAHFDRKPDSGIVRVGSYRSDRVEDGQLPEIRRHIGMIFQDFRLLPDRSVQDNISIALELGRVPRRLIRRRVEDLLHQVGLGAKRTMRPMLLSGGEQQRLGIARALAYDPQVLLADEPTGNLDREAAQSIMGLLRRINHRGTTVLMATHDVDLVQGHGYPCWIVEQGTLKPTSPL